MKLIVNIGHPIIDPQYIDFSLCEQPFWLDLHTQGIGDLRESPFQPLPRKGKPQEQVPAQRNYWIYLRLGWNILAAHEKTGEEYDHLSGLHDHPDGEMRTTSQKCTQLEFDNSMVGTRLSLQNRLIDAMFDAAKTLQVYRPCGKPLLLERETS